MNNQIPTTVVGSRPYLILDNQGKTIRFELTKAMHILGRPGGEADLVVPDPQQWKILSREHAVLRQVGNDYHIYDGYKNKPSTNGLFLDRTRVTLADGLQLTNRMELRIGQNPKDQIILTYYNPMGNQAVVPPSLSSISLKNQPLVIGRDPVNAQLHLESPIISRRHAIIQPAGTGKYLLQDVSTNGVFVNNQRVQDKADLTDGDTIKIGPYTLVLRGDRLQILDQGNQIRLDAENLVREVPDKDEKGQKKRLLDRINLAIEPGQFVALVGGSGTGKSTLMKTLLGISPTTEGKVYLNGDDLRQNFNMYRHQIGYVPQDDIIHSQLTVTEVLTYAAKLRLPPDIDLKEVVETTLKDIEMTGLANNLVTTLSGGQRKRVSIGVELLADPKLFFLDEPTSGLDPGLDKKMMELLRKLADQGRTIILVTHATANIMMCDRIVFMGRGGRLCYFGSPKDAFQFFKITTGDFADIYNQLESKANVEKWADEFIKSPYYHQYITNYLSSQPPNTQNSSHQNSAKKPAKPKEVKASPWQQLSILTNRYLKLTLRDPINLGLALLTAPVGIGLMTLALPDKNPLIGDPEPSLAPLALKVLFVFTCAALWVGFSAALQEIVKEAAIYFRERLVNLGLGAYLGSKAIVLGLLALGQTLLITGTILLGFKSPEPELMSWSLGLAITTFLSLFTCISLGLLVSAVAKNSSQANSTLPLLLLPQIIFSGVLFKMEGAAEKISWFMLSRWSVGAYGSLVNVNAMVPNAENYIDANYNPIPLPFEPTPVYDATWDNLASNWGMLLLHTGIYLGLTWWVQKRKDIC
jgi:ABC-type multidrug transport system ATPase subunit